MGVPSDTLGITITQGGAPLPVVDHTGALVAQPVQVPGLTNGVITVVGLYLQLAP